MIKNRLEKIKQNDPFEENGKPGLLLRHGFGLIDDTFEQIMSIVEQARDKMKLELKSHLIGCF